MPKTKKRADGRYCRQVYIGTDPNTGKRKYKSFYAATIKEADRLVAEYKAAIGRGLDPNAGTKTVEDLLDNLIAVKKAKGVGASWAKTLEIYKNHFAPIFKVPADQVRAGDVQGILNYLAKDMSHTTLVQISGTIKAAFDLAIPEIVQYNPCQKVVVPAGHPKETRDWLDEERQKWVIETPHRAQRAAMLMMLSGLRRGEATALTWADVDLDGKTISVTKSWDFAADKVKSPKTEAGTRIVNIPQLLADFLREERKNDPSTLYVIHSARGERMTVQAWKTMWSSYMAELNAKYGHHGANRFASRKKKEGKERGALPMVIKTFTPHELRHTFCTIMYKAGVDVLTARDQMGHKDISVTQGIYTHLDKTEKTRKMKRLDRYLEMQYKSNASQENA